MFGKNHNFGVYWTWIYCIESNDRNQIWGWTPIPWKWQPLCWDARNTPKTLCKRTICSKRPEVQGAAFTAHVVRCSQLPSNLFLVGDLEHFLFFHILGTIIPTLTNSIIFERGRAQPPTRFPLVSEFGLPQLTIFRCTLCHQKLSQKGCRKIPWFQGLSHNYLVGADWNIWLIFPFSWEYGKNNIFPTDFPYIWIVFQCFSIFFHFIFPFSWECHNPNWRTHMFRGVTTNQLPDGHVGTWNHLSFSCHGQFSTWSNNFPPHMYANITSTAWMVVYGSIM